MIHGVAPAAVVLTALTALRVGLSWPVALASVLTTLVLWAVMENSRLHGRQLVMVLTCVYVVVSFLNTLAEAVLFRVVTLQEVVTGFVGGILTAVAVTATMTISAGLWTVPKPDVSGSTNLKMGLGWRVPTVALCYCVLYLAAGMAVHPYIREFYADRRLPALPTLLAIQFVRGSVYVLAVLPWLRSARGNRRSLAPRLALIYSVLGGLAPLLLAGAYMPPAIRRAHAAEIGVSNFLFGIATGYLLPAGRRRAEIPAEDVYETAFH